MILIKNMAIAEAVPDQSVLVDPDGRQWCAKINPDSENSLPRSSLIGHTIRFVRGRTIPDAYAIRAEMLLEADIAKAEGHNILAETITGWADGVLHPILARAAEQLTSTFDPTGTAPADPGPPAERAGGAEPLPGTDDEPMSAVKARFGGQFIVHACPNQNGAIVTHGLDWECVQRSSSRTPEPCTDGVLPDSTRIDLPPFTSWGIPIEQSWRLHGDGYWYLYVADRQTDRHLTPEALHDELPVGLGGQT